MTDQGLQFPKFYVTAPAPCPYLDGRTERKVFTELRGPDASALNEALGRVGFRRSQTVVYRPACEGCTACVSVRVRAPDFVLTRSLARVDRMNRDVIASVVPPKATQEQFDLLSEYLAARHSDGSMADMRREEYDEMVGSSPVSTVLIEYRRALDNTLLAAALTDELSDGLSMVYSFFDPAATKRSLGSYVILDHIRRTQALNQDYVYLGYWVSGSSKMGYKERFRPLERLGPEGWFEFKTPIASKR